MYFKFVKEQLNYSHINQNCQNLLLYMVTSCCTMVLFESHVYLLLEIPVHLSYRFSMSDQHS